MLQTRFVEKIKKKSFKYLSVYEIMYKNFVQPGRLQMKIWRMRIAFWIIKATNTHSEYSIFIAFPLQQWLHGNASLLRYTSIAFIVR